MHERFARLARFSSLYQSSLGGKVILRRYLGLSPDAPIPLSLSHGVDFNHHAEGPQDYSASEPLHWCYNPEILARTDPSKPGVGLPHPWLLVREMLSIDGPTGAPGSTLIVGPPPSRTNDSELLEAIGRVGASADAILVKERGAAAFRESLDFWRSEGVEPVSAGAHDDEHYFRLAEILSRYDRIILPVFSSVGVFAAALGCEVVSLTDYWHCSYALRDLDLQHIAQAPRARSFARLFVEADREEQHNVSTRFLGEDLLAPADELLERIVSSLDGIERPVHAPAARGNAVLRDLMILIALVTGKIGFLRYGLQSAMRYRVAGTTDALMCKRVNMIDALLEGRLDDTNFESRPLRPDEEGVRPGEGAVF